MIFVLLFIIGACIGSLLGVCIDRIPSGRSIIFGRSRCSCGEVIPWYNNIPILSWILLRGCSSCCHRPIPYKLLIIELICACLLPIMWFTNPQLLEFIINTILIAFLLVAAFIDFDTMLIPDKLPILLSIIGLLASIFCPHIHHTNDIFLSTQRSLLGLFIGSGVLFWIGIIGELVLRKETIGIGDIQLIGAIGTFCGVPGCLAAIFGGSLIGTILLLPIMLKRRFLNRQEPPLTMIPFVPFLTIGTILFIIFEENFFHSWFMT